MYRSSSSEPLPKASAPLPAIQERSELLASTSYVLTPNAASGCSDDAAGFRLDRLDQGLLTHQGTSVSRASLALMLSFLPSVLALQPSPTPGGPRSSAASSTAQPQSVRVPTPPQPLVVQQQTVGAARWRDVDPWHPAARRAGKNLIRVYTSA